MTEINVDYPDLINLSADEQEQRLQLLKVEAKMTASATKDSAKADGKDVNIIRTRFANMNEGSKPIALTYRITSGDAVFKENNLKSIRKNTNNTLSSTVELISTTPGRGTLTATPVLNPTMAPPPVDYEFVGLPRNLFLLFTVDTDNQHSDGIAVNVVTALLTDGGNPVANERIDFDLSGVAQFAGGGTRLSVTTDASGKITLRITSNANADIAVKLTGTVISTSALHAVTINFKKKPVGPVTPRVADFHLERLVPTGIANDRRPAQVRAVAVLDTDSAVTVLFIRFISKVVSITKGKMDLVTLVAPGQLSGARGTTGDRLDAIEFTRTTTPTGVSVRGTRDVWLYQMDREATSRLVSAELLDSNMRVIASSLVSTNQVVSFTADGPPPPPPVRQWPISLTTRRWSANTKAFVGFATIVPTSANPGPFVVSVDTSFGTSHGPYGVQSSAFSAVSPIVNRPTGPMFVEPPFPSMSVRGGQEFFIICKTAPGETNQLPVTITQNGVVVWRGTFNTGFAIATPVF